MLYHQGDGKGRSHGFVREPLGRFGCEFATRKGVHGPSAQHNGTPSMGREHSTGKRSAHKFLPSLLPLNRKALLCQVWEGWCHPTPGFMVPPVSTEHWHGKNQSWVRLPLFNFCGSHCCCHKIFISQRGSFCLAAQTLLAVQLQLSSHQEFCGDY